MPTAGDAGHGGGSGGGGGDSPVSSSGSDGIAYDDQVLVKLGYKQELHRGFSSFMSFAFCFTSVAVLSSISLAWPVSMGAGGPSVLIWGWLICGAFTMLAGLAMAELCSTFPSAGSVYHWAAMLAPAKYSALACYVCGTFNFIGNAAGDASFAWGFASVVAAARSFSSVDASGAPTGPVMTVQQQVGVAIAVCAAWSVINALRVDQQGWVNNFAAVWQVTTTVAIIVAVISMPGRDPDVPLGWVWTQPFNSTGIDDKNFGYVCLIGLLSALFAFSGYEAGAHMAEETTNSSVSSPWGIVATCALVAATGLAYILGLLYATPSIMGLKYAQWAQMPLPGWSMLTPTSWVYYANGGFFDPTAQPDAQFNLTNHTSWEQVVWDKTTNVESLIADDPYYAAYYAAYGYAFSPPWDMDLSVHGFLEASMEAVAGAPSVASLYFSACGWRTGMALTAVLIINLFFAGISSLTVTSRIAFAMVRDGALPGSERLRVVWGVTKSPIYTVLLVFVIDALLLLLPLATTVALNAVLSVTVIGYQISYAIPIILRATTGRASFVQGAFNLGRWSMLVHVLAGAWLFLTSFIFLWPTKWPVVVSGVKGGTSETDNMNYTCVIVGVTFVISLVYWWGFARHTFKGPLGRFEAVLTSAAGASAAEAKINERESASSDGALAIRTLNTSSGAGDDEGVASAQSTPMGLSSQSGKR
jgi:amino acid transporter